MKFGHQTTSICILCWCFLKASEKKSQPTRLHFFLNVTDGFAGVPRCQRFHGESWTAPSQQTQHSNSSWILRSGMKVHDIRWLEKHGPLLNRLVEEGLHLFVVVVVVVFFVVFMFFFDGKISSRLMTKTHIIHLDSIWKVSCVANS